MSLKKIIFFCGTAFIYLSFQSFAEACRLNGFDIGYCDTSLAANEAYRQAVMPWCGPYIHYSACVPKYNPILASKQYPFGRWYNNTIAYKDNWVKSYYESVVEENTTAENKGFQKRRFSQSSDCRNAFRRYLCWTNFPRCNDDHETIMTCRSACENLMKSCGYSRDMWRCGESEYFNAYSPEKPTFVNGIATYLRDFYPGQPFQSNKFSQNRVKTPEPVCTPSMAGNSSSIMPRWIFLFFFIFLTVILVAY